MIVIGSRRRNQPAPPRVIAEALLDPDRDPVRPWLKLLEDEHRPRSMRRTDPNRIEWSSLGTRTCASPSASSEWHAGRVTTERTRHLGVRIERPADEVYAFAADPTNLPSWAPGLGTKVEHVDGQWFADSPMGRVGFVFAPHNDYGVLDHDVTLPTGDTVHNPMRVIADGPTACDVVFTLRRQPGMSDEDFDADVAAVTRDLGSLKSVLEAS